MDFKRTWVALVVVAWCFGASAQTANESAYMAQWLAAPSLQFGEVQVPTATLRSVYASRGYGFFWTDANGLNARGSQMLKIISDARTHGLNPERYGASTIQAIASLPHAEPDMAMRVRLSLELMISDAVMQYGRDLQGGTVRPQWNVGREYSAAEEPSNLLVQASAAPDAGGFVNGLAPTTPAYRALQGALQHYEALAGQGGWPRFLPGTKLKPGAHDARMATIRQILVIQGDSGPIAEAGDLYDAATVAGVKHFQARHGIEADGVLGDKTQKALAVPVSARIEQMQLTLERMRWMPKDLGSRYVLVNIPSYTLTAVTPNQQLTMKVIVGKPDTKTPMFSKNITQVVLNPSWGVPQKIAVNEMLPKLRKNPNYLIDAGYTVTQNGQEVDPQSIDWQGVSKGNFGYSFRQQPGDGNALGKVKFTIPDSDDIYLHDTAQRGLFERSERSLSHGCVRLGEPKAMAEFVLQDAGWSEAKIENAYEGDAPKTVSIAPLPVHLVYWTSWVDKRGQVHFGQDIYGMDKSLLTAMQGPAVSDTIKLAMN